VIRQVFACTLTRVISNFGYCYLGLVHPPRLVEVIVQEYIDGILVEVRRDGRLSRMTMRVPMNRRAVVVSVPANQQCSAWKNFVRENVTWIREQIARIPPKVIIQDGAAIPFRGRTYQIQRWPVDLRAEAAHRVTLRDNVIIYRGSEIVLHAWLRQKSRDVLKRRVRYLLRKIDNLSVRQMIVSDQTSRWGSCSAQGTICFSWRLIMAPPRVLHYVVAHEVAHLRHMNHGRDFWAFVEELHPNYCREREWLMRHGLQLHAYQWTTYR
jgi:predicted metal-dependent hydrolase